MPRLKSIFPVVALAMYSLSGNALSDSCATARKCNANCMISFGSYWRDGSPGFRADMQICEHRCMANSKGGQPERSNIVEKGDQPETCKVRVGEPLPHQQHNETPGG